MLRRIAAASVRGSILYLAPTWLTSRHPFAMLILLAPASAVVVVECLPGREEAWPARRCPRRSAVADLLAPLRRVCMCLRFAPRSLRLFAALRGRPRRSSDSIRLKSLDCFVPRRFGALPRSRPRPGSRSRGRKAPARERGGVACSSLFSLRRWPGREEAWLACRCPRRSAGPDRLVPLRRICIFLRCSWPRLGPCCASS